MWKISGSRGIQNMMSHKDQGSEKRKNRLSVCGELICSLLPDCKAMQVLMQNEAEG